MEEKIENGCIGTGEQCTDYLLSEGLTDNLPTLYEQDLKRFYYNQGANAWSKKSCTIFASIGAISDLFNYEFSESEIKEIDNLSYEKGRTKNSGWYVQSAVKLVADWRNEKHQDMKVAYYRIEMDNDALVDKVIGKNYDIVSGFYGNSKRQNDYYEDAVLNGTDFGYTTYGHCICVIGTSGKRFIKDNYKGRTGKNKIGTNVYELEHKISEIAGFHNCGYVFTKVSEDNIEEVKRLNELRTLVNTAIETNSKIWEKVNDDNYKSILHYTNEKNRKKLQDIEIELQKCK